MKLGLNLSSAPRENHRPFVAAATLVGLLGLAALVILSHAAYSSWQASRALRADISGWQGEIRTDEQKQRDLQAYFRSPRAQQVIDRSAFLNSLIDERSFPWTQIFMDLEKTLPTGVRVVSISPKLQNGRVQVDLQVGASGDDSKIQFLEAIEKSDVFSGMVVKDEHKSELAGPDKVVLNLTVWYTSI
jgi:hypothetical protein